MDYEYPAPVYFFPQSDYHSQENVTFYHNFLERQKVDIIVQFAIRDVLCAYTNFHTNIIVLDEIFDNLDEIGSRRVIDLISHQLTDISAIFIISHHAKELNLPYDRELVVRKDENGVSNLV
jgi:energy-coupling factor transporter ATP-binding protein EcfA2